MMHQIVTTIVPPEYYTADKTLIIALGAASPTTAGQLKTALEQQPKWQQLPWLILVDIFFPKRMICR